MEFYSRMDRSGAVRRRVRLTGGQRFAFGAVVALYTALLMCVTYVLLARPAAGDEVTFTSTDEAGNIYTQTFTPGVGEYNVLVLGMDREAMLTDVIMLVNINDNDHSISVMQIPRDTYVSGGSGVECSTHKINELYADYYVTHGQNSAEAVSFVKGLLERSLCISIHEAALVDLDGFSSIVDILGGVPIYVPERMVYDDPEQGLHINISAGQQTLSGEDAENFVRYRSGYVQGDLGRVNAQKLFLSALFSRFKEKVSFSSVTDIAGEVLKNVETDMSASDMVLYARMLLGCDLGSMKMRTLPGYTEAGLSHYIVNRSAALKAVNEDFNTYEEGDISAAVFDPDLFFTSTSDPSIDRIYRGSDIYDGNVYSGDTVNGDINIPRK